MKRVRSPVAEVKKTSTTILCEDGKYRCWWSVGEPIYTEYHDKEWGVPIHDDKTHFEFLTLEGAQAGLSWITVLRKREAYRQALDGFDYEKCSLYTQEKLDELVRPESKIVRNRLKVKSVVGNAKGFIGVREEFGSFDKYVWEYVDGVPLVIRAQDKSSSSQGMEIAERLSNDLKKRGFKFVGPTICYSYLQAAGLINDHVLGCFRCSK